MRIARQISVRSSRGARALGGAPGATSPPRSSAQSQVAVSAIHREEGPFRHTRDSRYSGHEEHLHPISARHNVTSRVYDRYKEHMLWKNPKGQVELTHLSDKWLCASVNISGSEISLVGELVLQFPARQ